MNPTFVYFLGIGYHRKAKTKDGYNRIFATNYLGHFLLTYLLVGKLKSSAPSRVVNVTSVCQRLTTRGLDFSLHVRKPKLVCKCMSSNLAGSFIGVILLLSYIIFF